MKISNIHLSILFYCFIILGSSSCDICTCKKITCQAFSDAAFDKWAPYAKDQLLIYKNAASAADTIRIVNIQKSEAYEGSSGGGYGCGKGCFSNAGINGTNFAGNDFQKLSINYSITGTGASITDRNISIRMHNAGFNATAVSDTGFSVRIYDRSITTLFSPSLLIGTKTFLNVQLIQTDTATNKANGAYKFYFSRDAGLVAWENYPSKDVWVKE